MRQTASRTNVYIVRASFNLMRTHLYPLFPRLKNGYSYSGEGQRPDAARGQTLASPWPPPHSLPSYCPILLLSYPCPQATRPSLKRHAAISAACGYCNPAVQARRMPKKRCVMYLSLNLKESARFAVVQDIISRYVNIAIVPGKGLVIQLPVCKSIGRCQWREHLADENMSVKE